MKTVIYLKDCQQLKSGTRNIWDSPATSSNDMGLGDPRMIRPQTEIHTGFAFGGAECEANYRFLWRFLYVPIQIIVSSTVQKKLLTVR